MNINTLTGQQLTTILTDFISWCWLNKVDILSLLKGDEYIDKRNEYISKYLDYLENRDLFDMELH